MKKVVLLLFFSISFGSISMGNIATPQVYISEIYFDSIGNWTIELGFYLYDISSIDSMTIETSTGNAKINSYTLSAGGGYPTFDSLAVITSLNLDVPITINPLNDYIKIISYAWGSAPYDYVAIGNYPGSMLDCIKEGESIIYLTYVQSAGFTGSFCISNSPSIGFGNDTTGALSTFIGYVYDINGALITQGWFQIPQLLNTIIHIKPDGSFSERIFSRRYTFDKISIYFPPWPYTVETYTIDTVDICLRPDTLYNQNIVATSIINGETKPENELDNTVVVSPNPFKDKITFYLNLERHQSDEISLYIFNADGKFLYKTVCSAEQKRFDWTPQEFIPSGVLIYQLSKNNQIVKTGKFIKL